ncbi:hypothetical protein CR513_11484, partial [Mucuna pruriens]
MGEKEVMISTPLPIEYVEGDEEALETSFQALEIVGTTSAGAEEGGSKLSTAAIMVAKVLISNGFQPGKEMGKDLDGIAELVALQENPGRFGLGYTKAAEKRRPRRKVPGNKWIRANLYHYFTSGGIISPDQIAAIEDQLPKLEEWVLPTNKSWTIGPPKPYLNCINTSLQINNTNLEVNNASESYRQDEGEGPEEEALVELERLLEQLETINLGEEEERQEIRVGKQMLPDIREKLVELLREYVDVFAWSYHNMLGLDTTIVEHKLPLIPNAIPIR